ncbi:MAG: FAD-dependent oxidoreductase, partial [Candidatus Roizmanbacteria bacterium]|nr:FAD-dependent oxidoreductase [Candidatus Roizmanbacteria bacterium]
MKRRVIIIGSGIGGLACACLLAQRGYEVDVFEKNKVIGGRAETLIIPHAFSEAFHLFFTHLNVPIEKYINLKPIDLSYSDNPFYNPYRFSYIYNNYDSPWDLRKPSIAIAVLTELLFPKKSTTAYRVDKLLPSLITLAKKYGVLIRT